jgi:pimeloyl-ACP methyl ester carboxylesterase
VSVEQSAATGRVTFVEIEGTTLAVRQWGDETGRPLFFWHALGLAGSGAWLSELAPTFTGDHGLRLVAVDGPGFGASPPLPRERYDGETLSALLWAVVDELELERPVLMGHSWGGVIVVHATADRPSDVAAVVLLDSGHLDYADVPGSNPDATLAERIEEVRGRLQPLPSREALRQELEEAVRRPLTDEFLEALEPGLRERPDGSVEPVVTAETRAAAMQGLIRTRPSESWPVLADAGVPVLLLLAAEPPETRQQNEAAATVVREAIPHADIRFCDGWGHDLIADGGPALAAIVGEWLARVRA